MSERIATNDLKPGMMIVQVTAQNGPVKIRKSGLVSSVEMIAGLAEMGVLEVEIDPQLTVEVEAPVIAKSQTQQLLEREQNREGALDQSMSEQFNRSLFLPSVQELPGFWQHYARQAFSGVAVAVVGLGVGFAIATHSLWLAPLFPSAEQAQVNTAPANTNATSSAPAVQNAPSVQQPTASNPQLAQPVADNVIPAPADEPAQAPVSTQDEVASIPEQSVDYEQQGRVLNDGTQVAEQGAISPELLQRFEQAINDLDNEPQQSQATEVLTMSTSDIPKVHELPAWVLTRLPSMAFSAHMYASSPDERWVRVNGKRVVEGQLVEDGLRLKRIEPQEVVLDFEGQEFSMAALTDW